MLAVVLRSLVTTNEVPLVRAAATVAEDITLVPLNTTSPPLPRVGRLPEVACVT